jgi:uncharacterized protein (DUF2147 family)
MRTGSDSLGLLKSPQIPISAQKGEGPSTESESIAMQVFRCSVLRLMISSVCLACILIAIKVPPAVAENSAVGLWEQVDESSGQAESWFRITERSGIYEGAIVKIFFKPGEDPNWLCDKCQGAERGAPVLGMTLIKGMRRKGESYEDGTITDPRDGSVYRALMRLSPDGRKLEVRGYLGISLFGRSQVWNRLPDNALGTQTPAAARPRTAPAKKQ